MFYNQWFDTYKNYITKQGLFAPWNIKKVIHKTKAVIKTFCSAFFFGHQPKTNWVSKGEVLCFVSPPFQPPPPKKIELKKISQIKSKTLRYITLCPKDQCKFFKFRYSFEGVEPLQWTTTEVIIISHVRYSYEIWRRNTFA